MEHYIPIDKFDEDVEEIRYLTGSCRCSWRGSGMFFAHDSADRNKAVDKLRVEHMVTGCAEEPFIGVMI